MTELSTDSVINSVMNLGRRPLQIGESNRAAKQADALDLKFSEANLEYSDLRHFRDCRRPGFTTNSIVSEPFCDEFSDES